MEIVIALAVAAVLVAPFVIAIHHGKRSVTRARDASNWYIWLVRSDDVERDLRKLEELDPKAARTARRIHSKNSLDPTYPQSPFYNGRKHPRKF